MQKPLLLSSLTHRSGHHFSIHHVPILLPEFFLLSCAVLYSVMKEGKSEIENYQSIGKLNGCDVYSSWHDRAKSREMFTALTKRHDIQCNSGGTAWMTLNFAQQGSAIIVCDRLPQDKNAQCNSIIYRQQNNDE